MRANSARAVTIAAALSTAACGVGGPAGPVVREHHGVDRGDAAQVRVEIDMSAGELAMRPGARTLFEGDFAFNSPGLKPVLAYTVDGGTGTLKVSQGSASGNVENRWQLSLDEATPIDLNVNLSAGDAELLLGRLNLQNAAITMGAGDLVVDLRGAPTRSYNVTVKAGAGDTVIHLPASVGIEVRASGLVGDIDVSGLEERGGRWINPRAGASPVVINVDVQHAIGDLRVRAE